MILFKIIKKLLLYVIVFIVACIVILFGIIGYNLENAEIR